MNEISIGAVGAAIIAGLVSLLGLLISKEQKISEFRQAWINDLRTCVIAYLVNINAICDALRMKRKGRSVSEESLLNYYRLLNEANHGIGTRVNSDEQPAKEILASMRAFEEIASDDNKFTPENIKKIEEDFTKAAKILLKFEWNRVKKGEKLFVVSRWLLIVLTAAMFGVLAYGWWAAPPPPTPSTIPIPFLIPAT